ncbi:MAG: DUF2306 domain-containing protein, partial [Alphaproteobacteria bacterium]|nr:DUF2306 domain-containing protein [Alphaproteobacteria bacterium]
MERGIGRFGLWTMGLLAVGVAAHATRFVAVPANIWLGVDEGIRSVVERVPLQALTHMIIAPIALFIGPFQFVPSLRARRPQLHRLMGRTYVAACTIAGVGALATAPYASGGPVAAIGFATLAFLWITVTL